MHAEPVREIQLLRTSHPIPSRVSEVDHRKYVQGRKRMLTKDLSYGRDESRKVCILEARSCPGPV